MAEWRLFVTMVQREYRKLLDEPERLPGPVPKPDEFWAWGDWINGGRKGPRPPLSPSSAPNLRRAAGPGLRRGVERVCMT